MFFSREIAQRLTALESRLERIETWIERGNRELRDELERKHEQLDSMSRQSLRVVELLEEARQEIERLKHGGS